MRLVQHVDCRSTDALRFPLILLDRRDASDNIFLTAHTTATSNDASSDFNANTAAAPIVDDDVTVAAT